MLHKLLLALIITFLLPVSPALSARNGDCIKSLPPSSERVGYWKYRKVKGQKCWEGTRKNGKTSKVVKASRMGSRANALSVSRRRTSPVSETEVQRAPLPSKPIGLPPSEPYNADIWPPLDETSFESRFIGESK